MRLKSNFLEFLVVFKVPLRLMVLSCSRKSTPTMKNPAVFAIVFFSIHSIAFSQDFRSVSPSDSAINFIELQAEFEQWSASRDLSSEKGWKWYSRWQEHYNHRTNSRGELVHPEVYLKTVDAFITSKNNSRQTDDSDWLPCGPNYLPEVIYSNSSIPGIARINCVSFHPSNENIFWIGASQGGVWKTTDGGLSWTPLNDGLPVLRISDITIDPIDPDIMYACLGDFEYNGVALNLDDRKRHTHYGLGVYKTTDGGLNWSPTGLTVLQEDLDNSLLRRLLINPNNTSELLAGGFEGIWRSIDGGDSWTNVMADLLISDLEQDPNNPSTVYAASTYVSTLQDGTAGILKSTDFGQNWTWQNTGIPITGAVDRIELAIAPSNSQVVYAHAVDLNGGLYGIYRTTNGGANWQQQTDSNTPNIMHWYEGNGTGGQGSYDLALVVDPLDENLIYSGGVNMWGSDDGGITWDGMTYWVNYYGESIHADQHQFKFNPLNNRFYVVNDGGIYTSNELHIGSWEDVDQVPDYQWPTTWTSLSNGMQITSFYRVGFSENNPEYLVAGTQDNGTFYFDGDNWKKIFGGDGMDCLIHPEDPGQIMASSQYGSLGSSFDGGFSWNYGLSSAITSEEAGEWTTPFFYNGDQNRVFAGFGNLWVSSNFGQTWNKYSEFDPMPGVGYPAPASAIAQCTSDPQAIYFAHRLWYSYGVNSDMWVTLDGGDSWENVTAGLPEELFFTDIVVDAADPLRAWVTCSGFDDGIKVFETVDGGQSWQNISLDLPNIPANCIAHNENSDDHTLYLGTDIGVFTTNDFSNTWEPFTANLPNVIVSDLDFNPSANILYAATFGRGIWKTDISTFVGIPDQPLADSKISLFPNPNSGTFSLQVDIDFNGELLVEVINVMGATVDRRTVPIADGNRTALIPSTLSAGIYYAKIQFGNHKEVIKFMVR
jgi:photosystem II stability/assembly factor-like uncharacterized protein